ncbi:hypothetical protein [Nocardia sp. NPDC051463]|uniref:hypothetical protein n=1 Tax=Nocardia sp. NPDC051463 TaxID=3154845 RepID=UPI00344E8848
MTDLIAKGRRLLAAATPGPWDVDPHAHREKGCRCLCCHDDATVTQTTNMLSCDDFPVPDGRDQERCEQAGYSYPDAELIVWMRNNLPGLLDELETWRSLARDRKDDLAIAQASIDELEAWKTNAEITLAEDKRWIDRANAELEAAQRPPLGNGGAPALADFQRYLTAHQWLPGNPGPVGTLWTKGDVRIGVPHGLNEHNVLGVLERLARAEQRTVWAVIAEIREVQL